MPRLQHSDRSGLRVVILKGEVVLRCHDLLFCIPGLREKILSMHKFVRPVVSGKNWTAAARAPGKLLLKLKFPGCAHCRADGGIFVGNCLHLAVHPCPVFNIPIEVVCAL